MPSDPALAKPVPPRVWLMGFTNLAYGFAYAAILLTLPQMLRERGAALREINDAVSLALFASLFAFVLAPILDTTVSRRSWATGLLLVDAVGLFAVFNLPAHSPLLAMMMPALALGVTLYNVALGGWLGASLPKSADRSIGTWFNIANGSGFGIGALVQYPLMHGLPAPFGALVIAGAVLLPLVLLPIMPPPDTGRSAVHESFNRLGRDIGALVRQPPVLRLLALFLLPCASFALTNTVGGMGTDYNTPPYVVDLANGVGTWGMAVVAGLLTQRVIRHIPPAAGYVGVGVLGGLFTLVIAFLPHTAAIYVIAALGENFAQSAAFTAQNAMIFGSIAEGSPVSATQFGLLGQAAAVPLTYMERVDGRAYDLPGRLHGAFGTFLADAVVSLIACALIAPLLFRWVRTGALEQVADIPDET